jgi:hypothetical protein
MRYAPAQASQAEGLPAIPCAAHSGSWHSTFSVSTVWIAASVKTSGWPRRPVPSNACHARSGNIQTVRSPFRIGPRSYSRQFYVRYRAFGPQAIGDALLMPSHYQEFCNSADKRKRDCFSLNTAFSCPCADE